MTRPSEITLPPVPDDHPAIAWAHAVLADDHAVAEYLWHGIAPSMRTTILDANPTLEPTPWSTR